MKTPHEVMVEKAEGLYVALQAITETPWEAVTIVQILHLQLWMAFGTEDVTVDHMLDIYCSQFRMQLMHNEALRDTGVGVQ